MIYNVTMVTRISRRGDWFAMAPISIQCAKQAVKTAGLHLAKIEGSPRGAALGRAICAAIDG